MKCLVDRANEWQFPLASFLNCDFCFFFKNFHSVSTQHSIDLSKRKIYPEGISPNGKRWSDKMFVHMPKGFGS